jgi:hypothetical protein
MRGIVHIVTVAEVAQLLREIYNDGRRRCEKDLQHFVDALDEWLDELFERRLPANWRDLMHDFLAEQEPKGYSIEPENLPPLEDYILNWAEYLGLLPATPAATPHESKLPVAQVSAATAPPASPPSTNWPRLTPAERERVQKGTGLPGWYPLQPRNRTDSLWEQIFEEAARAARDRLSELFRNVSTTLRH